MRFGLPTTVQIVAVVFLFSSGAGATEPPALRSNPFARPPSVTPAPTLSAARIDSGDSGLELRATMVGTRGKLANVAGKTLRPGDEYLGYTLVQVFEDRAVFLREGRRLTVYVKPDLEETDEE